MYLVKKEYDLKGLEGGPYAEINELILEMVKKGSG
jgi:aspartate ammonia-lyase